MDKTNDPDRRYGEIPPELESTVARLRSERPSATAIELDTLQRRVRARIRYRGNNTRGTMKSRIAVTLMLVFGIGLSTTGAGLAVTGPSGQTDAAGVVYGQPGGSQLGGPQATTPSPAPTVAQETAPTAAQETAPTAGQPREQEGNAVQGVQSEGKSADTPAAPVQVAAQAEVADATTGDSLPFTGFSAIPVLLAGLALMGGGLVMRRRMNAQGL